MDFHCKQLFRKRSSMLRYTCIVCLITYCTKVLSYDLARCNKKTTKLSVTVVWVQTDSRLVRNSSQFMEPRGLSIFSQRFDPRLSVQPNFSVYALSNYFCKILVRTVPFHKLYHLWLSDNKFVHPSVLLHPCYMSYISYHHSFEQREKYIFFWVISLYCISSVNVNLLHCLITN